MAKKKVLITGVAGLVGVIAWDWLKAKEDRYELYGLARRFQPSVRVPQHRVIDVPEDRRYLADISDFEAVQRAVEGKDVVVHMAADPKEDATWESVLLNNIVGAYNIFEASREAGVGRVIFASTNHVVGMYPLKQDPYKAIYEGRITEVRRPFPMLTADMVRPDGYYGVSKAFGEALGSYYHDKYGISVICLRIGWVMEPDDPSFAPSALSLWLSHRDCAQLIERSIDAPPSVGFAVVYGMSRNSLGIWDIEGSKRIIGFDPQDGAGEEWHPQPGRQGII